VCCDASCAGLCEACTAAKKGSGSDGVCGAIAAGLDPDSECAGTISCNGAGACTILADGASCSSGLECASGFCVDEVCCDVSCAGLCEACTAAKRGSGSDGVCDAITAGLDPDSECAGLAVCDGSGACKRPYGSTCTLADECVGGVCVDGVCCDASCAGLCEACTAAKKGSGSDGVCGAIAAGLDPDSECAGTISCNGAGACAP